MMEILGYFLCGISLIFVLLTLTVGNRIPMAPDLWEQPLPTREMQVLTHPVSCLFFVALAFAAVGLYLIGMSKP